MSNTQSTRLHGFTGRTYNAREVKSATDPIVAILTYPLYDIAGDYVVPSGGDWSPFEEYNVVNWSHRVPIGRGDVYHKAITFNGETVTVAIGEGTFFTKASDFDGVDLTEFDNPNDRKPVGKYSVAEALECAIQANQLVRKDIATGVSIEFTPDGKYGEAYWDLGKKSLLENRNARFFKAWKGYTWAYARSPVNPGCRTLLKDADETIQKAYDIAQTGRMPTGERVCKIILKSLQEDMGNIVRPVMVSGGAKDEYDAIIQKRKREDNQVESKVVKSNLEEPAAKREPKLQAALYAVAAKQTERAAYSTAGVVRSAGDRYGNASGALPHDRARFAVDRYAPIRPNHENNTRAIQAHRSSIDDIQRELSRANSRTRVPSQSLNSRASDAIIDHQQAIYAHNHVIDQKDKPYFRDETVHALAKAILSDPDEHTPYRLLSDRLQELNAPSELVESTNLHSPNHLTHHFAQWIPEMIVAHSEGREVRAIDEYDLIVLRRLMQDK